MANKQGGVINLCFFVVHTLSQLCTTAPRQALHAVLLVVVVAPLEKHHLRVPFVRHDVRGDFVEEPAVVADDQRLAIAAQRVDPFEYANCVKLARRSSHGGAQLARVGSPKHEAIFLKLLGFKLCIRQLSVVYSLRSLLGSPGGPLLTSENWIPKL
jgi:hypothetical protein